MMAHPERSNTAAGRGSPRRPLDRRTAGAVALVALLLTGATLGCAARAASPGIPGTQGNARAGAYDDLAPEQQRLIDQFLRRYNEIRGTELDSAAYDALPFSVRTTFQAVTHALANTALTDARGESLGTALELVREVEMVHGQIIGAGGDEQFRIYVRLRDDALTTLEASREFPRDTDNTFFHTDYPMNFRQRGTPSIQFSIAADGRRADIDVDYRSTQFPMVLFDGHLSVANSDVRAPGNYPAHVARWQGLLAWWRNLFGLHTDEESTVVAESDNFLSPMEGGPRISEGEVEEAIEDFMAAWLVERDPETAIAYFAEPALNCARDIDPGAPTDELAALRIVTRMEQLLRQIGEVDELGAAVSPKPLADGTLQPVEHAFEDVFTVVEVAPTLAAALLCAGGDTWRAAARVHNRGPYRGASLAVSATDGSVLDLFQVWGREGGTWKIIAFHVDGRADAESVLELEPRRASNRDQPIAPHRAADAEFASAVGDFFATWLLEGDAEGVRRLVSPRAFVCAEVLMPEPGAAADRDESWRRMERGLSEIARRVAGPSTLREEIAAIHPWNPDLRVLDHADAEAYTLLEVPDHLAASFECTNRAAGRYHEPLVGSPRHDRYRAAAFRLRLGGGLAPGFVVLWERENADWRVVSFSPVGH